ncbi:hypothetical protein ABMY26_09400 [Azospirillum sp. HJ39]|uniref:hypothetical protein n=1 Tax=Azospirillum sp. HJ39 TaxID=3159496 RepID=UPI003558C0E4
MTGPDTAPQLNDDFPKGSGMDSIFAAPGPRAAEDSVAVPDSTAGLLRDLTVELREASAPIEATFLGVGDALGRSLGLLNAIGDRFRALSTLIDSEDGSRAVDMLTGVCSGTDGLAGNARHTLDGLDGLEQAGTGMAALFTNLSAIIGEITALAINAKVQSVQIRSTTDDFSVFNREIDRLHRLAEETTAKASSRLVTLRAAITTAKGSAAGFQHDNRAHLDDAGTRLRRSLDALVARRAAVREAACRFADRVEEIGRRIARCIGDLQVGDVTSQRLAHIGDALEVLRALTGDADPTLLRSDRRWLATLEPGRRAELLVAICELQGRQCRDANRDFAQQVASLAANLAGLLQDAGAIAGEAQRLFGSGVPSAAQRDGEAGPAFLQGVAAEVDRALQLLDRYCRADEVIRAQVVQVSDGFGAMRRDVAAIHSIDVDMRLMGLNTTLKCTRLGPAGRALGVVAQELRACSRRTEDVSEAIAQAIRSASERAGDLDRRSADDHLAAAGLTDRMTVAMGILRTLQADQERALQALIRDCATASGLLGTAMAPLGIGPRQEEFAERFAQRLALIAGSLPAAAHGADVAGDLHRLFGDTYTVDSERLIHGGIAPSVSPAHIDADGAGMDDFFL